MEFSTPRASSLMKVLSNADRTALYHYFFAKYTHCRELADIHTMAPPKISERIRYLLPLNIFTQHARQFVGAKLLF